MANPKKTLEIQKWARETLTKRVFNMVKEFAREGGKKRGDLGIGTNTSSVRGLGLDSPGTSEQ
jgi:hypothetical protein